MENSSTIAETALQTCDLEISIDSTKAKERRQKRADIQIYRPGALRLMKEAATKTNLQTNQIQAPSEKPKIAPNEISTKKVVEQDISCKPKGDNKNAYLLKEHGNDAKENSQFQLPKEREKKTSPISLQKNGPKQNRTYNDRGMSKSREDQFRELSSPRGPTRYGDKRMDYKSSSVKMPLIQRGGKLTAFEGRNKKLSRSPPEKGLIKDKSFVNENIKVTVEIESSKTNAKPFLKNVGRENKNVNFSRSAKKDQPRIGSLSEDSICDLNKLNKRRDNRERPSFSSDSLNVSKPDISTNKNCPTNSDLKDPGKFQRNHFPDRVKGDNFSEKIKENSFHKKVMINDTKESSLKKGEIRNILEPKKEIRGNINNPRTREMFDGTELLKVDFRTVSQSKNRIRPKADNLRTEKRSGGAEFLKGKTFETSFDDLKLNSSLEDSSDDLSECESSDGTVNPMLFVEFENSFNKNIQSQKINTSGLKDTLGMSRTSEHSQNIRWADEKWSPVQKQRTNNKNSKEMPPVGSPAQRGIIQFPTSSSEPNHESLGPMAVNQKTLFNPNNPSKPVVVSSATRDISASWDNATYAIHDGNKTSVDEPLSNTSLHGNEGNDNDSKLDPSIFYNIQKGEMDINYYVGSNQLPQEFRRIMDIRLHLQGCYRQLLMSDIRLCQEKNLEGALWKSLYYVIIEKLREYINRDPSLKDRSLSTLHIIIDEGHRYLQGLLTDLQQAYGFSLDAHLEKDLTAIPTTKNRIKQAIHSCQKILLSIGDLARYKEQYSVNPNFCVAKNWYQMALQVQPRNGRPFNQLAIIAVSLKRPLDVVYYYVRSLSAANPFTSARDSLISMFDDIRKKYETMEKKPLEERKVQEQQKQNPRHRRGEGNLRQEIWIRPDSGATNKRTLSQTDPEEEVKARIEELMKLQTEQLMKSFLTCYLHCHGMLFSKVGLDHFTGVLGKTLDLFQALLRQNPPRMSPVYLLQIMAINMFAIENTQLKDSRLESGYRSAAQELALLLGQEMFARLAEVMVNHFPSSINYTPQQPRQPPPAGGGVGGCSTEEGSSPPSVEPVGDLSLNFGVPDGHRFFLPPLAVFVPAAKVWCDWLLYQSFVWNPPPTSHDLPPGVDGWGAVGELATIVKGIGPPDVAIFDDEGHPPPDFQPLVLPEDKFLRGYSPIMAAHRNVAYSSRNCSSERCRDWLRIKHLQVCLCRFLCGIEPPILKLQKTDKGEILVPVVAETPPDTPSVMRDAFGGSDVELENSASEEEGSNPEDELEELDAPSGEEDSSPLASTVRLLAHRKKVLERKQRQQRKLQALMEGSVTLEIEVRPRYLVPDTNCFIEYFDILKALINRTPYTLMIPLVVLNELKGLSKDAAVDKYGDISHAVTVREDSSSALDYLMQQRSSSLKYVTSEGSVLNTSTFTDELNVDQDSSNDDKILSCCINFCSSTTKRKHIKDGVRHIYREVVLLTEDRNLRVKAYARDVPVRDLLDFAHWAGIK